MEQAAKQYPTEDAFEGQNAWPQLKGRVALVTGGGGGLGAAICQALCGAGVRVVSADVREKSAQHVAASLSARGASILGLGLDVTDPKQVEQAVAHIVLQYGQLDFVVNNAGIDATLPVEELPYEDWQRILAVNLSGPFIVSQCAFPVLKKRGGHIVNIVSTAAKRAWANAAAYHASKWGLLGLSHALHVEGRPHGIKVTAVISGGMRTPFLLDRFPDIDLRNLQEPRHVADTICFVLSQPPDTVIPEVMVLPMRESSWP